MPDLASGSFDPETVALLRMALRRAWDSISSRRRTPQVKTLLAKAIIGSATQGERDPIRLKAAGLMACARDAAARRYDFELRHGDETIAAMRSIEITAPKAVWTRVAELAKRGTVPGGRIRVTDQSGEVVIFMGVAAARLLAKYIGAKLSGWGSEPGRSAPRRP